MNVEDFKNSLSLDAPMAGFTALQLALWHTGKNNWQQAHDITQMYEGENDFDRLHAYLHRVEGDESNARYWYRRCNTVMPDKTPDEEYEMLIKQWIQG